MKFIELLKKMDKGLEKLYFFYERIMINQFFFLIILILIAFGITQELILN